MAEYPTIDPRAFGHTYSLPQAVTRLPVNLLRTSLVTRQPEKTAVAMQQYRDAMGAPSFVANQILPQRMMFQQHKKSPEGGVNRPDYRAPLSSALTLSAAMAPTTVSGGMRGLSAVSTVSLRTPERVPTYDMAAAAAQRGSQAFPQPEVSSMPTGIVPRVRPLRQPIAPPLQAYGDALQESQQMRAAEQVFRTSNAMRSISTAREGIRKLLRF